MDINLRQRYAILIVYHLNDAHLNRVHGLPQYLRVIHHDHHAHGLISARCDHYLHVNHLICQVVH